MDYFKWGCDMKTFKITRVEKIKEYQIIQAKNEEEALNKSNCEDWDDDELYLLKLK